MAVSMQDIRVNYLRISTRSLNISLIVISITTEQNLTNCCFVDMEWDEITTHELTKGGFNEEQSISIDSGVILLLRFKSLKHLALVSNYERKEDCEKVSGDREITLHFNNRYSIPYYHTNKDCQC